MCDAEIAAILLNRLVPTLTSSGLARYLDLLREGNLRFRHLVGEAKMAAESDECSIGVETLIFIDGSRALRIQDAERNNIWTNWTALDAPAPM